MTRMIATVFGIGHLRPAPGTWGSLAALPLAYGLHLLGGFWLFFLSTIIVTGLGWWATQQEIVGQEDQDPSEIVIDEVAGQWIALWPVSFGAMFANVDMLQLWPGILTAFVVFRLFDILKPGPVGWADGLEGPTGVMLDDVIAGWLSALVVAVLAAVAHLALI
ncbi:phosphatidylglycerophosphatase A [Roseobacter sp. HKCCD9010]|uniref:phosphatidylglycerophosphatase A family protein n=1 Tax=Rhodobacterales TaxID=204455 RepID=UPI00149308AB|nr:MULTISPECIES: phosphatidylglycerophosphatase A [Rhodobacterales]MBF9050387.1 phosphatidylglycerophosphatase A [Rhodobacterales bacterium HKCCD4356]NNV12196.1 phosphatidylglycerophosphatase A [Roseobacter sp. HKCCD7357]NNV17210.1 phosphatidylglycerophosphatase A [Roseobacter sp. HKCCD8768]NNV26439.1 phosphatidylglycerophosphatase A [Roseobacter sp. HKCCD8192]NNV30934.1 phosphatidylglycerophosphatase A [Roseobacter sp. HKCCD9061]